MRLACLIASITVCAGLCRAAEFKSDEAVKAAADYEAAVKASKTQYGQGLVQAKKVIDGKRAAAADAVARDALQRESDLLMQELTRLHSEIKGEAEAGDPKDFKSEVVRKARADFEAALKTARMRYTQDLVAAQRAVMGRKAASADGAIREAFQQEADRIAEELKALREEGKTRPPPGMPPDLIPEAKTRLLFEGNTKTGPDGVAITGPGDKGNCLWTAQEVAVPFKAQFVAKTDSTNIRIQYGLNYPIVRIIFNWETRPNELRLHSCLDGKKERSVPVPGQGKVPRDQWVSIDLVVTQTCAEVFVDGKSRGKLEGDYAGKKSRLGIRNAMGSVVTVKSFRIQPLD